jgi:hypothetical protein
MCISEEYLRCLCILYSLSKRLPPKLGRVHWREVVVVLVAVPVEPARAQAGVQGILHTLQLPAPFETLTDIVYNYYYANGFTK